MKGLKKLILYSLIIAIAVVVVAVVGIILFFPKEKVKEIAIEKISSTLGRQVAIEGISVSFIGGIGAYLEGIRISNPEGFPEESFLEADALDVKLQFWPLLKKRVVVDRLILVRPNIRLRKRSDGMVNYQFGVVDSLAPPAVKEKLPEESKMAVSAISFDNLVIKRGKCNYLDDSLKIIVSLAGIGLESELETPEKSNYHAFGKLEIDSVSFSMDTLKLPSYRIKASYDGVYNMVQNTVVLSLPEIDFNGLPLRAKAEIPDVENLDKVDIEIRSDNIPVSKALNLLPENQKAALENISVAGDVALQAYINYNSTIRDTLQYHGNLGLSNITVAMPDYPGKLVLSSGNLEFKTDRVELVIDEGNFEGNPFEGSFSAADFDNPQIKGQFAGSLDLASLDAYLPKTGDPRLAGRMTYNLSFYGMLENLSRIQLAGGISVDGGSYSAATLPEPVQAFSTDMKIDGRDILIDKLAAKFPSSDFSLSGRLANAFPYFLPGYSASATKPYLTFNLTSHRLDVDKLFPEVAPGEGTNLADLPPDSLPPIVLPDINGAGKGDIDTLIYTRVEFTNITSDITIKERKIFMDNVEGSVYTGKVTGKAVVDLNDFENPVYTGTFDARQIEADDFLTRFTKFGGHLFGKLNMTGDFAASGWEPDALMKSLTLNGDAIFNEAKLVNFDLIKSLGDQFNFTAFDEETVKDFSSSFKVVGGRVHFDALKFFSNFGNWNIVGSVGFDGSLDYSGDVLLTEKVSQDLFSKSGLVSGLASMLKDGKTERVRIPFKLGGTYGKPKLAVDFSFKEKLQEKAKDELKDKLQDKVGSLKDLFKKK
jgi:hypothetical protein